MVYEHFSHEVYSIFMVGAFAIPLIGGIVYNLMKKIVNKTLFTTGWITLLVGSYMRGVLEIFGTTNRLLIIYLIVGCTLLVLSLIIRSKKDLA